MARTVNTARRAERKSEILQAAMQCFAEKGFHSTSMQDVCFVAGMSPGTLYRYFSSKDDIIIAIVDEERGKIEELTVRIGESDNLYGAIGSVISQVAQQGAEPGYAQLSAEVYAELFRNEKATTLASEGHLRASQTLSSAFLRAIDDGKIDPAWSADALAELLLAFIDSLDARPEFMRRVSDETLNKTVAQLIALAEKKLGKAPIVCV